MENQWQEYFEQNQKVWNERVETHLKSEFYDQAGFIAGKSTLTEIETNAFGDVNGKTLLHLQCHFGQDTMTWSRRGAKATGIDFSEKAIEAARNINAQLGLDAQFVHSDVYDLPNVLNGQFDYVFTTFGGIPWLPDLEKWAAVIGHFLKPGGTFYMAEFHPTLYLFNFDNYKIEYGYFTEQNPYSEEITGTYADHKAGIQGIEHFWNHSISEVMMPLIGQGLQVLDFQEFDFSPYNCFPNLIQREPGRYVLGNLGVRLPHVFSLKMQKMD